METAASPTTKFSDPWITAKGHERASVSFSHLETLWFNTGTLCNLACHNCYIESSPTNDQLAYLTEHDVLPFLNEVKALKYKTELIGLTGGEPFLNPHIQDIIRSILEASFTCLILTNGYRVLKRHRAFLMEMQKMYGDKIKIRISLDHYTKSVHEQERGINTFESTVEQLLWLEKHAFCWSIAGRSLIHEPMDKATNGYYELLKSHAVDLDPMEMNSRLVIFPEMVAGEDVPEITTDCWDILGKSPDQQMCATERMIVRRKGATAPVVLPCTLLAYDHQFELGDSLSTAGQSVPLNHEFCAKFCVLGGSNCSQTH